MADFSDAALANARTQDLGEVGDLIVGVVGELKGMDADEEKKGFLGFFRKQADKLETMKDSSTIFGVPVRYIRDLYDHPVEQSLTGLDVPVFIAQGKNDFQTSLEDYKSWQSALEGYAGETRFALYDGLNHLFADNSGAKGRGTSAEYLTELHVSDQLLDDIADWVGQHNGK